MQNGNWMMKIGLPCRIVSVSIQDFELPLFVLGSKIAAFAVAVVAATDVENLVCGVGD